MPEEDKEKGKKERTVDVLNIGNILSGLGDFLETMEKLAEKGEGSEDRKIFEGKGYKGEISYRIGTIKREAPQRVGIGVRPGRRYDRMVTRPHIEKTKTVEPETLEKEPLIDVFDKDNEVLIVASLPNIKEENIDFKIEDNVLKIIAETPEGKIEKEIKIPEESKVEKIKSVSFKHGIIELKLSKKKRKK